MTPKTLFIVILKIIGLLFIKEFLTFIPQFISIILSIGVTESSGFITSFIMVLLLACFWIGIIYLFIFRPGLIINKLSLDKGFDEEIIPLSIHRSHILSISLVVIGGLIITNELPNLVRQFYNYWLQRRAGMKDDSLSYVVLPISKVFVGLLLIIYQRHIVNFIEYKRKNKVNDNTP